MPRTLRDLPALRGFSQVLLVLLTFTLAGAAAANGVPRFLLDGTEAASAIAVTMSEDSDPVAFVIDPGLTAEDTGGDTNLIVWSLTTPPVNGLATVSGMGATPTTFSYVPSAHFNGSDSFVVTLTDSDTLTDTLTVNVTIDPVNDAPVFVGDYTFAGKWGSPGTGNGQFEQLTTLAVDSAGNIYSVGESDSRIQKFAADGTYLTQWGSSGTGNGQFTGSYGIATDSSNNIYLSDRNNDRIQKFDSVGTFLTAFGSSGTGDGQFTEPTGIVVAPSGNIYVADQERDRVQKFDSSGNFLLKWGSSGSGEGEFNRVFGIALDASENVYAVDFVTNRMQVFDSSGNFLRGWGSGGSGNGQFSSPFGVTIRSDGMVFVVEFGNNRVQRFDAAGNYLSQLGTSGSGDGQFNNPLGLAINDSGRFYVGELSGARIQYFEESVLGTSIDVAMDEDSSPTAFSLPLRAFDVEGDTITWSISSAASQGTAEVSGTGSSKAIAYVPVADYNGMDSFDVHLDDGNSATDTVTVNVTINPQNDAPVITQGDGPLAVTMDEDASPTTFSAPTLDATDADDDTLTWSVSSPASQGTATVSGMGAAPSTFTYVPNADFNGMDSFTIQVSDANSGIDTIEVNVTIGAQNDAPVITQGDTALSVTMDEDSSPTAFVAPTLGATDVEMDTLTWSVSSAANNGTATVSGMGGNPATFSYVPNANFNGSDSFSIQVSDSNSGVDTIVINVTVDPQNDAPVITQGDGPLAVTMDEDASPTAFSAPTVDATDVDDDTLTWSVSSPASQGTATVSGMGVAPNTFTYVPNADFNGMDSFTILADDSNGGTDTIVVNVMVNAQSEAPTVATNTGATVTEGGTVILLSSMLETSDADSGPSALTYTVTDGPTDGMLVRVSDTDTAITSFTQADINATQIVYVHDGAENATDEFDFSVSDGTTTPDTGTFTIAVTPVDDAPSLYNSDGASVYSEDGVAIVVDAALTVVDPDGGDSIEGARVAITTGYVISEDVLSLTAMHGITGSFNATEGVLTLSGMASAAEYQEVLRSVVFSSSGSPDDTQRAITFSLGGAIAYSENGHFYRFETAQGISWDDANTAASALRYFGLEGYLTTITTEGENTFVVNKLSGQGWMGATDVGAEGTWRWVTGPEGLENGGLGRHFYSGAADGSSVDGAHSGWATGEPNDFGTGEDYAHFLANGQWNDYPLQLANITGYVVEFGSLPEGIELHLLDTKAVDVALVNDAPVITQGDGPLTVNLDEDGAPTAFVAPTLGAIDEEGDPMTWTVSSAPASGTATVTGMGTSPTTFTYTPSANFNGVDSFVITVADDSDATDTITVNVTINAQNDVPTIDQGDGALSVSIDEDDTPTAFTAPTVSATDIDGDTLTWSVVSPATSGTATVGGNGASPETFTYVPTANANGMDSFTIQVDDSNGGTDTIVVNVIINPQNDSPVITQGDVALSVTLSEDGAPVAFVAPALDATDVDGDTLTWTVSSAASNGTATVSGSGSTPATFTYTPTANFNGSDSFIIHVDDGNGGVDTIPVSVVVTARNDGPLVSVNQGVTVAEGETVVLGAAVLSATDVDDSAAGLTYTVTTAPVNGQLENTSAPDTAISSFTQQDLAANLVEYVHNGGETASDSFAFTLADGGENGAVPVTGTFAITVTPVNDMPTLTAIGSKEVVEGATLSFTLAATDPEGDVLSFDAADLPSGATFDVETATFSWRPSFEQAGVFMDVLFRVTDGGTPPLTDTETISISVGNVNRPPSLDRVENQEVAEDMLLSFTVTGSDPDGDAVTFGATNLPTGATFDTATAVFSWTPGFEDAGVYADVVFTITDAGVPVETDTQSITITVGDVNRMPELAAIGSREVNEGETISFMVTATDADNDTLSYTITDMPDGAEFDTMSQAFTWTPDFEATGTYDVTFTVADDGEPIESDSETITITVADVVVPLEGDLAASLLDIFDEADADGDGLISRSESLANFPELTAAQFDTLDTNEDGFLDGPELGRITPNVGCFSPGEGTDIFAFGFIVYLLALVERFFRRFAGVVQWMTGAPPVEDEE